MAAKKGWCHTCGKTRKLQRNNYDQFLRCNSCQQEAKLYWQHREVQSLRYKKPALSGLRRQPKSLPGQLPLFDDDELGEDYE